jgi:hypothetical protein
MKKLLFVFALIAAPAFAEEPWDTLLKLKQYEALMGPRPAPMPALPSFQWPVVPAPQPPRVEPLYPFDPYYYPRPYSPTSPWLNPPYEQPETPEW